MPKAWSNKRERQYEHVKDSEKKKGRSTKRAKEIAARTVNKTRSQKGETKDQRSSSSSRSQSSSRGSSSGNGQTKQELYQRAKKMGIEGRSKMSKQQLQKAVSSHA